jgi:hypothetical protein
MRVALALVAVRDSQVQTDRRAAELASCTRRLGSEPETDQWPRSPACIPKFLAPSSLSRAREFRACDHILDTYPAKTSAGSATADFTIPTSSPVF